ncbi:PFL_4669 family integrating conjugative element protein [Serratia fonticola]|uniref:TIGR03761 family integrating conjugative element protein n=1 Tax=Serratia fonticola TaxID=47917 RepID=A0AAW3WJJ9_SERFO|nr:TIGR03761 family integrating conjugative element protein [Serratia fonticola]MBC3211070.1 TIGR03761 family integrating conjugative element protein [Serratia fonticola]NYA12052.1 TIGR03761 family integrating conjugative element protein [Serratia fonticola]NYA31631.1 TIGR03761 family integrating conjugative element protein [Serratia fonticola]
MTESVEKNGGKKVGALHSELRIDLHTFYAISTWEGRKKSKRKGLILGMPQFFKLVSKINRDSLADNPYADAVMYQLEKLIDEAHQDIQRSLDDAGSLLSALPKGITLSSVVSSEPLNIAVHSHTPLGYRCVYLLVGFDQLALKLFQAHHYGFISRRHRDHQLQQGGYLIRRIFTVAHYYRSFPISRRELFSDSVVVQGAQKYFDKLDEDVLLGKVRSRFSPPVNAESLRLLNDQLQHKARETKVTTTFGKQTNKDVSHESE